MVKSYACAGILLFAIGLFPLMAQDNTVAKEMAIKIADRIIASTVYEFKDVKTGKVYTSLDNVALNPDIRVNSKYLNWHYKYCLEISQIIQESFSYYNICIHQSKEV